VRELCQGAAERLRCVELGRPVPSARRVASRVLLAANRALARRRAEGVACQVKEGSLNTQNCPPPQMIITPTKTNKNDCCPSCATPCKGVNCPAVTVRCVVVVFVRFIPKC
jgi:hypothetical protein